MKFIKSLDDKRVEVVDFRSSFFYDTLTLRAFKMRYVNIIFYFLFPLPY